MFWAFSILIAVLAMGLMAWPLLRKPGGTRNYGLALVLLAPIVALTMYRQVGSPEGIGVTGTPRQAQQAADHAATGAGQMDTLVAQLEQRLQENPANVDGWVLLGRTYKSMGRYDRSVSALVRAAQLAPDDAMVLVELAEARMFASGEPRISNEVREMLERALLMDPNQQKGLWLLGVAASRSGNDALALELWERLATQLDPASGVAASLNEQIAQARERLGVDAVDTWSGLGIEVNVGDPGYQVPAGAVLFVVARNPDMPGPPVGVRRILNAMFPVNITLTDSDSMVPQAPISAATTLQLVARLSLTGNVIAGPGDLSSATLQTGLGAGDIVSLTLSAIDAEADPG
jgi:cytochrome c-type biogenesis protein CcmH